MKDFTQTGAANVTEPEYPQDKYQKASDIVGLPLILLRANVADTQYGTSAFVHFNVDGDPEHTDYTTVFSEQSYAFRQLQALIEANDLPIRCAILSWSRRSFQLGAYDPALDPARTRAHKPAWEYAAIMASANPKNQPPKPTVDHYDPDGTARDAQGNAIADASGTDTTEVPF